MPIQINPAKKTPGKVVFVSMPTKGSVLPTNIAIGHVYDHVYKDLAKLTENYPDHTFVAPLIQGYCLLSFMKGMEPNWEQWADHCRRLVERSDEVWVLLYDGWSKPTYAMDATYNTSQGVRGELEHAAKHRIPVSFVDPSGI